MLGFKLDVASLLFQCLVFIFHIVVFSHVGKKLVVRFKTHDQVADIEESNHDAKRVYLSYDGHSDQEIKGKVENEHDRMKFDWLL